MPGPQLEDVPQSLRAGSGPLSMAEAQAISWSPVQLCVLLRVHQPWLPWARPASCRHHASIVELPRLGITPRQTQHWGGCPGLWFGCHRDHPHHGSWCLGPSPHSLLSPAFWLMFGGLQVLAVRTLAECLGSPCC